MPSGWHWRPAARPHGRDAQGTALSFALSVPRAPPRGGSSKARPAARRYPRVAVCRCFGRRHRARRPPTPSATHAAAHILCIRAASQPGRRIPAGPQCWVGVGGGAGWLGRGDGGDLQPMRAQAVVRICPKASMAPCRIQSRGSYGRPRLWRLGLGRAVLPGCNAACKTDAPHSFTVSARLVPPPPRRRRAWRPKQSWLPDVRAPPYTSIAIQANWFMLVDSNTAQSRTLQPRLQG